MNDTPLLLVDVETTGIEPRDGALLEIGFAVVTAELDVAARRSWVLPYRRTAVAALRADADPVVREMHDTNGLWDACAVPDGTPGLGITYVSALDAARVGAEGSWRQRWPGHRDVIAWVDEHAGDPRVPLCGSSVHFDQRWLAWWFPEITTGRTYRLPDSSGMRELLDRWAPSIGEGRPGSRKLHRVDNDLDDTLAELRHYRKQIVAGAAAVAALARAADMCARPAGVCLPGGTA